MRICEFQDLGLRPYQAALDLQQDLADRRKRGEIPDQFLIVEHPHVVTMGRNAHAEHLLAGPEILARAGIELHHINRGGDVTYHGPGQIVGYPILDLRDWKRDVVEYLRMLEQVIIGAIADFGVLGERNPGKTGVWVRHEGSLRKVAALGVHLSRWVTSHGFALNLDTDLSYFRYIVPCGLTEPVTSLRELGVAATRAQVVSALADHFARGFGYQLRVLEEIHS